MRQAQRIQQQMETVQASIAQKTIEATSGGGAVKVVVSGDGQLKALHINPDAVNKDDVAFLEDFAHRWAPMGCASWQRCTNPRVGESWWCARRSQVHSLISCFTATLRRLDTRTS